jgi:hypothetical protein
MPRIDERLIEELIGGALSVSYENDFVAKLTARIGGLSMAVGYAERNEGDAIGYEPTIARVPPAYRPPLPRSRRVAGRESSSHAPRQSPRRADDMVTASSGPAIRVNAGSES